MNFHRTIFYSALLTLIFSIQVYADPIDLLDRDIPTRKNIIVFPNGKGEVVFNHTIHSKVFKEMTASSVIARIIRRKTTS